MNYAWLDDMLCSDDDNIIKGDAPTSFLSSIEEGRFKLCPVEKAGSPEPEFLINLLKMLPEERHDSCEMYGSEAEHNMAMPQLEEMPCQEQEMCENVCREYREVHQRWHDEVGQMMHRFRLMREIGVLRAENQQLRCDNVRLRGAGWDDVSGPPEQLPQLLTPSNDISVIDDGEEQSFDPQIDRAKLKTKLCKYFLQNNEHESCPFFRRHGWCAFAHGETELTPTNTPTSLAPLSPTLLLNSPTLTAMSPLSV